MLDVDSLSSLLFQSSDGNQLITQLNEKIKILIENDKALAGNNSTSPSLWKCLWLNDQNIDGYSAGHAIWLNTQTPQDIVNTQFSKIEQYVEMNSILKPIYDSIDKNDSGAVNRFMLSVVNGTASNKVSRLFYLGNILNPIQIRVSKKNNNKDLPNVASSWYDFYVDSTPEANLQMLSNYLSDALSTDLVEHVSEYHLSTMPSNIDEYAISTTPFNPTKSFKMQQFFDHSYCESMAGFDYVVSTYVDITRNKWHRSWKSGYVEQGGVVAIGEEDDLTTVDLPVSFDYPNGVQFYQSGYGTYHGLDVDSSIASQNRYVIIVTPIKKSVDDGSGIPPYAAIPNIENGIKLYSSIDVTNITNSSFSIVNTENNKSLYQAYSWHACGYTVH